MQAGGTTADPGMPVPGASVSEILVFEASSRMNRILGVPLASDNVKESPTLGAGGPDAGAEPEHEASSWSRTTEEA